MDRERERERERDDYTQGRAIVNKLLVTNDSAERGVAVVQEFNKLMTYEEQFHLLLQVMPGHRRRYPDCRKSMLQEQHEAHWHYAS